MSDSHAVNATHTALKRAVQTVFMIFFAVFNISFPTAASATDSAAYPHTHGTRTLRATDRSTSMHTAVAAYFAAALPAAPDAAAADESTGRRTWE